MNSSLNENQLIVVNIIDVMQDYVSLQIDIDETKVKAAAIIAQNIDLKRLIGSVNLKRAVEPNSSEDEELVQLLIPSLCYFTYSRLLKLFNGSFNESGYTLEEAAIERNATTATANEIYSIGESFMQDVSDFLEAESPEEKIAPEKLSRNIRVFGGVENRASN